MAEAIVTTNSSEATSAIFGAFDANVRKIEMAFDVRITDRRAGADGGTVISVTGEKENVEKAVKALREKNEHK